MKGWMIGFGALLACAAVPAGADVKAGVEAWGRGEYRRAVDEWRPLAIAGNPDAQFNLGQAYKLGRGVPLDPAMAQSWFLKAANQGHIQAQDNYGLALFQDGRRAEAAPWLERSATRGEPRAELVLGTMLFNGDGVQRDYPRAYALITRSSQTRDPQLAGVARSASETLAQMDGYISPADRQRGTELAQRYAAEQDARAVADLGSGRVTAPVGARQPVSAAAQPLQPAAPVSRPAPRPTSQPPSVAARSAPVRHAPAPAPMPIAANGRWRVQLGAFRDAGNARAQWARVGGRVGGSPAYVSGGGMTRLQAGPFATRAAAQHACAAAGDACTVVAP